MVTNGKDIVQGVESNTIEGNTDTQNHSQVSEAIFTPASLQDTNTNLVAHEHANHEHANIEHKHANIEHEHAIIEHKSVNNSTIQASQAYFAKV